MESGLVRAFLIICVFFSSGPCPCRGGTSVCGCVYFSV